ncbi:hypothetical protein FA15DRAFT_628177 [Coprinopsis marcescibilis]|uniref:Fido domain-containing protein n=1 Tax=Coprinopsis marcescibilis TaxID=230819 RepID=A0A5C3KDT0_COPMA|nr:hypothetical protein FA15DRAFT_628177 [Coprinopsis marcescibilis]
MSAHAVRLTRLFTPQYVKRINAQIVHPSTSVVVKPNELESALARPLHLSFYEPDKTAPYFAATLSYGIIKGHPFMDGNKRTAFFIANEYIRAMGLPGLADGGKVGVAYEHVVDIAQRHMDVAAGKMGVEGLAEGKKG